MHSKTTLASASVSGLFGKYTHRFTFDDNEPFVILHGENGVGKTKFLEIINAASHMRTFEIARLPFESASLVYSDNSTLKVQVHSEHNEPGETELPRNHVTYSLSTSDTKPVVYEAIETEAMARIRQYTRFKQLSDEWWEDRTTGEHWLLDEIFENFEPASPADAYVKDENYKRIKDFTKARPTVFIETHRLQPATLHNPRAYSLRLSRQNNLPQPRITERSEQIRERLNKAQREHSEIAQNRDRTFPSRVLEAATQEGEVNEENIRERYREQNSIRDRLANFLSSPISGQIPLRDSNLQKWELTLLDLYLKDSRDKLRPLEDILIRLELLEKIINKRLSNKTLRISYEHGLQVTEKDSEKPIDLEMLSSGEQHEIILMTDLLLNVSPGTVVLIDEPEISLHIAWQMEFINDVRNIAETVGFQFVVATHSPQLIDRWWENTVALTIPEATS
ncbi:MAG: AAA family ATPase [Bowdeniella nasicola]|nr:AAA family ATPase [Bowdeniella nasicola]